MGKIQALTRRQLFKNLTGILEQGIKPLTAPQIIFNAYSSMCYFAGILSSF